MSANINEINGGTELPICSIFWYSVPTNLKKSGKLWSLAASLIVKSLLFKTNDNDYYLQVKNTYDEK